MAQKKEKTSALVWIILAVVVAAAIWYYARAPTGVSPENVTAGTPPAKEGAAPGDLVALNFVLSFQNGSVISTNNATLARQFGLKNYAEGPFRFIVGQSGLVKGFDEAVLGMRVGDSINTAIEPSEPVLEVTVNRTRHVIRNQPYPRFRHLTTAQFEEVFKAPPTINKSFVNASLPWPYVVSGIANDTVTIEPALDEGKTYHLPGYEWNSTLVIKTNLNLVFRHNPENGQVIDTEFGPATVALDEGSLNITYLRKLGDVFTYGVKVSGPVSMPYDFKVVASDEKHFVIKRINYPAQEQLNLTAQLLEWLPHVKTIKKPIVAAQQ